MKILEISEVGRRVNNEDITRVVKNNGMLCCILCDGAGGYDCGEVAAFTVADSIEKDFQLYPSLDPFIIKKYIEDANQLLKRKQFETQNGQMMTTLVLLISDGEQIATIHVGDSRILVFNKEIFYESKDHSLVNQLLERGEITQEEVINHPKKNIITKAMGMQGPLTDLEVQSFSINENSIKGVILCTDGLWENYEPQFIVKDFKSMKWTNGFKRKIVKKVTSSPNYGDNYSGIFVKF